MKQQMTFLVVVFCVLIGFSVIVEGGTFTILPWTNDADSGINLATVYTHSGKFLAPVDGDPFYAGNGVWFEGDRDLHGIDWTLSNIPHSFDAVHGTTVTGDGAMLLDRFVYGDDDLNDVVHPILEVSNLTPGQKYVLTCYAKGFGGTREVEITPSDDPNDKMIVDQGLYGGVNGLLLKYSYLAPNSGRFSLTFDQVAAENVSWHHYAFSNEEVSPVSINPDPAYGSFTDLDVTLNFEAIPDEGVDTSNLVYNLAWGADPNVTNKVDGLTESSYLLSDLDESTEYFWQVEVFDGEEMLFSTDPNGFGNSWIFTTKTLAPAEKALEYKMDSTGGVVVAESIGGFDGVALNFEDPNEGGTAWVEGFSGNSLNFDGMTSVVDLGNTATLPLGAGEAFSISGYVKTTDSEGPLVAMRNSTDGGPIMALVVGYNGVDSIGGTLRFISREFDGGPLYRIDGPVVNDGDWNHFALTRETDGNITLYVNGQAYGSVNDGLAGYDVDLRAIGSELRWINDEHGTVGQRYLSGQIDEVVIWSGSLKQSQIAEMVDPIPYRLNPAPANDSDVSLDVVLSWNAPLGEKAGATYDVYVGTDPQMNTSMDGATGLDTAEFALTEPLDYETRYYWQVDVVVGGEIVYTSPVWTIKTISATVGSFTVHSWTGDGDSGISNSKTYTHSGKFSSGGADGADIYAGNGVNFEGDTNRAGINWTLTGTAGVFGPTNPVNVSGDSRNLALGFFYGDEDNNHPVLTITGLVPDTKYVTTFYTVGFGPAGARFVDITPSDNPGNPTSVDQNGAGSGNGQLIKYTFTAQTTEISFTFDAISTADSWHQYAFSNEVALPFELSGSPAPSSTVPTDVELSWVATPAEGAEDATYNLYLSTDPGMATDVVEQTGLVNLNFTPGGLAESTQYYWKVDGLIDGQVVFNGPVWTFYTASTTPATKILEWKLDEGTGTATTESFGSGVNGTLINFDDPNGAAWADGIDGTALNFDGVDDYLDLGDTSAVTAPQGFAFSLSGYFKTTDSEGPMFAFRNPGILSVSVGYDGADSVPGYLRFISWSAGILYRITGPRVDDGLWHHYAVTRSGFGNLTLYVDGVSYGSTNDSAGEYFNQRGAFGSDTTWQEAGHGSPDQRYLDGLVDEFTIWQDELQTDQIAALAGMLPVAGDVNGDGVVDVADLRIVAEGWLSDDGQADINGSGQVDLVDFGILSGSW